MNHGDPNENAVEFNRDSGIAAVSGPARKKDGRPSFFRYRKR
jgi:hypothetical protein